MHRHSAKVLKVLDFSGASCARAYVSPKLVVRAVRRKYRRGSIYAARGFEVVLNVGRPNYEERKFIADCQKVKMKFPVNKVILNYPARAK